MFFLRALSVSLGGGCPYGGDPPRSSLAPHAACSTRTSCHGHPDRPPDRPPDADSHPDRHRQCGSPAFLAPRRPSPSPCPFHSSPPRPVFLPFGNAHLPSSPSILFPSVLLFTPPSWDLLFPPAARRLLFSSSARVLLPLSPTPVGLHFSATAAPTTPLLSAPAAAAANCFRSPKSHPGGRLRSWVSGCSLGALTPREMTFSRRT